MKGQCDCNLNIAYIAVNQFQVLNVFSAGISQIEITKGRPLCMKKLDSSELKASPIFCLGLLCVM